MEKKCLFCSIAQHKTPAETVYEDDDIVVFDDINPKSKIHLLIVPKKHIESISRLKDNDKELMGLLFIQARDIAKKMGISESGFKIIINTGSHGGQIIDHLHVHLLGGEPVHMQV